MTEHERGDVQPKARPDAAPDADMGADSPGRARVGLLGQAAAQIGRASLQRKLQRRALQRKAGAAQHAEASSITTGPTGPGEALPAATQQRMNRSFGVDLSDVRVHQGEAAPQLGAQAFAQGTDLHFAPGKYQPGSPEGDALIGHELAHVVQQSQGRVSGGEPLGKDAAVVSDPALEHEADVAGAAAAHGEPVPHLAAASAAAQPKRIGAPIQLFDSEEHQTLGNAATGNAQYNVGGADKFELTHGDLVALSGDIFAPDELFSLAAVPGNKGQKVGSRDEILWGLQDETIWEMRAAKTGPYAGAKDPRFQTGGPYADYVFSDAVKASVRARYQKLAANNTMHFAAPHGRDAKGGVIPGGPNGGGTYHSLHEVALFAAYTAGGAKGDIGPAMAREAAAQHFLTDGFSAGHLRTPIADIRAYWGGKYPLFWYNLRHKIALDTAIAMVSGTPITNHYAYTQISGTIEGMASSLPAITLGDIIGLVFHNVDNEKGVPIQGGGKVMGDGHLDAATQALAVAAIKDGDKDVEMAYELGKAATSTPADPAPIYAQVRAETGAPGATYKAEARMPRPTADAESQNWKADSVDALWDQPMLGKGGQTVGAVISDTLRSGSVRAQLDDLANKFPESQSGLHPRNAYQQGFVAKLAQNPKAGVLDMINWAPHDMDTGDAPLDSAQELEKKGKAGDPRENLAGMTVEQRARYLENLYGHTASDAHQEEIVQIFQAAPAADRPALYQRFEGHPWNGDFVRSLGSRDKLYYSLTTDRVDRLKKVINGS